jgi:hypothetical protein
MQARTPVLALFTVTVIGGFVAFMYLGSHKRLPPSLVGAYGQVETLASSASKTLAPLAPPEPPPTVAVVDAEAPPPRVHQTAPLSSAQLSEPLVHGRYVTECGAPDDMKVVVKVTVRSGRAIAVDVATKPPNAKVASCVKAATKAKEWDVSPSTQHATATY